MYECCGYFPVRRRVFWSPFHSPSVLLQVCASLLEDGDSLFKMLAPDSLLVGLSIALVVRARPATSLGIPCRSHCVELIQGLRFALFSA